MAHKASKTNTGAHSAYGHGGEKFLGDTKGNDDLETNRNYADKLGGDGESHKTKTPDYFCGPTKGNTDLPTNRTEGVVGGQGGGQHKAGGMNAGRPDKY